MGCPAAKGGNNTRSLPPWLEFLHSGPILARRFAETIPTSAQLRDKYMKALQSHVKEKDCNFCMKVHILEGEKYCEILGDISTKAWSVPALGERPGTPTTEGTVSRNQFHLTKPHLFDTSSRSEYI